MNNAHKPVEGERMWRRELHAQAGLSSQLWPVLTNLSYQSWLSTTGENLYTSESHIELISPSAQNVQQHLVARG